MWMIVGTLMMAGVELPMGPAPAPLGYPHFPDRLHAFVWRNWMLVSAARMGEVVGASQEEILKIGRAMGLEKPPPVGEMHLRRASITIIRRNWHLLPYDQLLKLLDWSSEEMAYALQEDDFLFVKLGRLKPACEPLRYAPPDEAAEARAAKIAAIVRKAFPPNPAITEEPLFGFIAALSEPPEAAPAPLEKSLFSPRFCSSYFGLYGDPLLAEEEILPEGYLARLAGAGVDGIWLQGVLYTLAPFPWDPSLSIRYDDRLARLNDLVNQARKHGIGIYLYLNEPRSMPLAFFKDHPELKGVQEGDRATLCTSVPAVQAYLKESIALICERVPGLAGFFTISASENLTHCWSHHHGRECPRCEQREPAEVIAELHTCLRKGIEAAGSQARLIAWDWGWSGDWIEGIVRGLPREVAVMSVSEWSISIVRGGIQSEVGEYSISEVGPGPRATRSWGLARACRLPAIAKIQANNTWELASVPYIPAVENVARHAANLRKARVDGLMLGWTLGGCPSPNLEVVAETGRGSARPVPEVMAAVAERRYGPTLAPTALQAWRTCSRAFAEFPFHIGAVYLGPQQMGPANLLWETPTGYKATMVGIPYDDLDGWRAVYPPEVFIAQFAKMAHGFEAAARALREAANAENEPRYAQAAAEEADVMEVCALHFRSVANQGRFIVAREALGSGGPGKEAEGQRSALREALESEIDLARRLYAIQSRDSRFGFEASNHYFYVPTDLIEKVLNCRDLLERWLPAASDS